MPLKTIPDEPIHLNLTSMIDVMLLLVIFFMMSGRFTSSEQNMSIKVPQVAAGGPLAPAPEKRVINVYRDGRITLDKQDVSLEQLREKLAEAKKNYRQLGVIVRGDSAGAFQNVADVLATCREIGIADLGISVRIADGGGKKLR